MPTRNANVRLDGQLNTGRPARLPHDPEMKQYVLDSIMANAFPGESLQLSLSRLAMAAGWLGYETLWPTAVWLSYRRFKHLSTKPYVNK